MLRERLQQLPLLPQEIQIDHRQESAALQTRTRYRLAPHNLYLLKFLATMPTEIKCPNCGHHFPMEEAMSEEYKKDLRDQMQKFIREKESAFATRERELQQQAQQQEALFSRKLEEEKS